MKQKMFLITLFSFVGAVASAVVYYFTKYAAVFSIAITCGTIFYHFAMRLAVGYTINGIFHDQMDHTKRWFRVSALEQKFYKMLRVKKWKSRVPTYNPQTFQLEHHSLTEILQATCQSEIVHETIMVLSFVPIIFSLWFGALGVFLGTSCAACLYDSMFVIIQRYNRPRLFWLVQKEAEKQTD